MKVKNIVFMASVIMLLFLTSCNVIPPGGTFQQVAKPQFSPTPGTIDQSYVDVTITTATPDASIFFTVDGSIPQEMEAWLNALSSLNDEVYGNENCLLILEELEPQVVDDINNWWSVATEGVAEGEITLQQIASCQNFISNFQGGYPSDLSDLIINNYQSLNDCNQVFSYLKEIVSIDNDGWKAILDEMDQNLVLECESIFDRLNNDLPRSLTSILYVDTFRITKSTTIRAVAYKDGMWSSDIVTAEYILNDVVPATLTVDAGADQKVTFPNAVNLHGKYTYNSGSGLEKPITTTWSKVSGPGTVTFENIGALMTTASFSTAGVYTLRLTATDGTISASDTVLITSLQSPPPQVPKPNITITSPKNGDKINKNEVTIEFSITAVNTSQTNDLMITKTEFFRDGNVKIGEVGPLPRVFVWQNVMPGEYPLTAKTTTNDGQTATSQPVRVIVDYNENMFPVVQITSPVASTEPVYTENQDVTIVVKAEDYNGFISRIELQKNGTIIQNRTFTNQSDNINGSVTASFTWKATIGDHLFTARGYDNQGASSLSNAVPIKVNPYTHICGDGICGGGETCSNCKSDCGSCPSSGGSGGGGSLPPQKVSTTNKTNTTTSSTGTTPPTTTTGDSSTFIPSSGDSGNQQQQPDQIDVNWDDAEKTTTSIMTIIYIIVGIILIGGLIAFLVLSKKKDSNERETGNIQNPGIPESSLLQVKEYIDKLRDMGKTNQEIKDKLKSVGWKDEQLNYIFHKFG